MRPANSRFTVVVGEHNLCDGRGREGSEGGQVLVASHVFEHPNYARSNGHLQNYIAILEVNS